MRYHKRMFSLRNICAKKTWHFLFSFPNRIIFYNHIKFKDFEMFFFPHLLADAAGSTTRVMAGWTVTSGPSLCRLWRHVIPPPRNVNARVSIPTFVRPLPHQLLKNCSWSQLILILNGVLFLDSKRIAASPPNGSVRKRVVIEIIKINYQHIIHTA